MSGAMKRVQTTHLEKDRDGNSEKERKRGRETRAVRDMME